MCAMCAILPVPMKSFFLSLILASVVFVGAVPMASAQFRQPYSLNSLIKGSGSAVYFRDFTGRHAFPNVQTFYTWFSPYDFWRIQTISDTELAAIPLRPNIAYKGGSRLIKITTDPKVYAVDHRGQLRWLETEDIAETFYGSNWRLLVDDMPDAFFANYAIGPSIASGQDLWRDGKLPTFPLPSQPSQR